MRKGKEKKPAPAGALANAVIGSLIALGISLVLLLIASGLVVSGRLPERMMGGTVVLVLFFASLIGALAAIRRNRVRALIVGISEGAILYALTFVGGAFAEEMSLFGGLSLFLFIAALAGGAVAGLLCNRPKKRKI